MGLEYKDQEFSKLMENLQFDGKNLNYWCNQKALGSLCDKATLVSWHYIKYKSQS